MTEKKAFVIDRVSWHTDVEGNPEAPERVRERFAVITYFLQDNGLVTHALLEKGEQISNEYQISSADLTTEGLEVMKIAYDRWLKKIVNKNKDIRDLLIFENALAEVRGGQTR